MMKSKIHGARATQCNLNYQGSLAIDSDLMKLADLYAHEKIQVINLNTGARLETYVIEGEAGSGMIGANGGTARLINEGDVLLLISYVMIEGEEAATHIPKVILLDENNKPLSTP